MTISVSITKENKDGSADALIRFEKEDLEILVQWGFVAMLKEAINEYATADQINARANARNAGRGRKPAVKKTKPTIAKPIAKNKK